MNVSVARAVWMLVRAYLWPPAGSHPLTPSEVRGFQLALVLATASLGMLVFHVAVTGTNIVRVGFTALDVAVLVLAAGRIRNNR